MTEIDLKQRHADAVRDIDGRPPSPWPSGGRIGTVIGGTGDIAAINRWLVRHSITLLRISMGAMIFMFGILKYVPGLSPAEDLVLATMRVLTLGLVPDSVALVLVATFECCIGLSLMTGWLLRIFKYLQIMWVLGVLSPVVLLPARMFDGPHNAPTLEGQYVLKDVVFLAAAMVILTATLRTEEDRGKCS